MAKRSSFSTCRHCQQEKRTILFLCDACGVEINKNDLITPALNTEIFKDCEFCHTCNSRLRGVIAEEINRIYNERLEAGDAE